MTILTLLSQGLTAEGLARRLSISPRTVGKHLEHIYRKLDVCDRLMAVQTAHELGLLTPTHLSISTIIPNRIFPQPSASAGIANFPCCCGMPRQTGLASSTPLLRQMFISCVRPEKWSLIGAPLLKKTVLPGESRAHSRCRSSPGKAPETAAAGRRAGGPNSLSAANCSSRSSRRTAGRHGLSCTLPKGSPKPDANSWGQEDLKQGRGSRSGER